MTGFNWGRLAAVLVLAVGFFLLLPVLGGLMMAGGGCEGRPSPCVGNYTPALLLLLVFVAGVAVAAAVAHVVVGRLASLLRQQEPRA